MRTSRCLTRRQFIATSVTPVAAACLAGSGLLGCATLTGRSAPASLGGTALDEIDLFVSGTDGYHTYRIPALVVTNAGTVLAFCEGRKVDGGDDGDIDLLLKRSTDGGRTWSAAQLVYEEGGTAEVTIGNPCPVVDRRTGTIWLPFCRNNDAVLVTHSTDDGRTWAAPRDITRDVKPAGWGWYATGPGNGIQIQEGPYAGRLVIPCDHREQVDGRTVKISHVFYSDDAGRSWQLGGSVALHTDECQVAELSGGRLMINMRNYWERDGGEPEKGGMRAVAVSDDGGATWSDLVFDEELVEPVCQASLLRFNASGRRGRDVLLFSNPATRTRRVEMTVRASYDEGRTWPVARMLYEGPAAYSSLAALSDAVIGCLYERGTKNPYEKITLARFSLDWLRDGGAQTARG